MSRALKYPGHVLATIGLIFLTHSGYSTREHLQNLKLTETLEGGLPSEIIVECIFSAIVAIVGLVLSVGSIYPISNEHEMKKYKLDGIDSRSSFHVFGNRGSLLYKERT
ncbi:hypothetical protein EV182_005026, partial [Spiromyces aspiralis]